MSHAGNSTLDLVPNTKKRKELPARMPHPETPPRKFLCRKREASKFQKGNSKKEQEHCKELPPRKLHLSNLQPDNGKLRNFHSQNSTQVSLAEIPALSSQVSPPRQFFPKTKESKELPARIPHPGNFSAERGKPANPLNSKKGIPRRSRSTARNFHPGNST